MYLKSLEITGFKSFAKKSNLEFNTSISAIVGPNGSGKSNIAEAFRFVLGEQSIKSLRGKKGEDLIFNGSGDVGKANRASVKVIFDNSKKFLNIDFPEVSIERVVFRDSVNEYYINGSQVRLRDILELLASAHIGSSGHHIISQGEADKILSANFKEKKSIIEDALGLKIYQYKRQESERKLLKTEENIKSVESLRREIAPHMKFLKKQVEKVEKSLEMKEDLRNLYKDYLKREDVYVKESRKKINEEGSPLRSTLKELENNLAKARDILSKSSEKDKKSDEVLSVEEKIKKARDDKDNLLRDGGRIEGEINSLKKLISKQKELGSLVSQKGVALDEVQTMSSEIEDVITEAEQETEVENIYSILKEIRSIIARFISKHKNEGEDSSGNEYQAEVDKLIFEKSNLDQKIYEAVNTEKALLAKYEALKEDIEKEKDSSRDAERAVFKIMSEQNEIISKLNALKAFSDKLAVEEENLKRELSEGAVLIGRGITDFVEHTIMDENGVTLSVDGVCAEPRNLQEDRRRAIEKIKIRLEDAGLGGSEEIMKEYKEVSERDEFLAKELVDLEKSAVSLKQLISELEEKLNTEFKLGVEKINKQFQQFFTLMFGGGQASLSIIKEKKRRRSDTDLGGVMDMDNISEEDLGDEEGKGAVEIEEEGIEIAVNLPRKKTKGLMMLSGGERALTSIALLFAISQVNPPPFIILDETDAALDEANSRKYGDMVENLSKHSQLILITHNRETMSRAGILYGVTMDGGGVSKLLSIQFEEAVVVAK
ncbi:MAG: AAA family ATPase [Parcubacteria group bacterium]|nr:AAA family ATPase [Parcubacteria group bacterium]